VGHLTTEPPPSSCTAAKQNLRGQRVRMAVSTRLARIRVAQGEPPGPWTRRL